LSISGTKRQHGASASGTALLIHTLREFYDPDTVELMRWIMYVELAFMYSGKYKNTFVSL